MKINNITQATLGQTHTIVNYKNPNINHLSIPGLGEWLDQWGKDLSLDPQHPQGSWAEQCSCVTLALHVETGRS